MKVVVTRASVAAGDDIDAPYLREFEFPDNTTIDSILRVIVRSDYLGSIDGGRATWSAVSGAVLAVVAQQWDEPKDLFFFESDLDIRNSVTHIHFNYHAQIDPVIVEKVLFGFRLTSY